MGKKFEKPVVAIHPLPGFHFWGLLELPEYPQSGIRGSAVGYNWMSDTC